MGEATLGASGRNGEWGPAPRRKEGGGAATDLPLADPAANQIRVLWWCFARGPAQSLTWSIVLM